MKLTRAQLRELYNQHTGTGYIIIKTSDNNIRIADIQCSARGDWFMGLNGKSLICGLGEIAKELKEGK